MVVVWLCEREKVVLRENLKVCVVVVWVYERERVVLREMGLGFGAFRISDWVCERKAGGRE